MAAEAELVVVEETGPEVVFTGEEETLEDFDEDEAEEDLEGDETVEIVDVFEDDTVDVGEPVIEAGGAVPEASP